MCREKLYIVFALLFVMLASNVVAQAQPSLTIQNASAPVGNSVDVNVSFTNPESNVGSIQFDVVFNSDVARFDNAVAGAALSPWTIFVQERGAGRVTIGSLPDATSPETVISEGDIFVLNFTGLAENMSTALDIELVAQTASIFSTFDGVPIEPGALNAGSIMVVGGQPQPPTPTPGDANADGFVNLADLGVIINAFRGTPAPGNGDCNGDTFTNLADLGCVITDFRGPITECPCNFDLEFWTRSQWVFTPNGLFDECSIFPEPFPTFRLTGLTSLDPDFSCMTELQVVPPLPPRPAPTPPPSVCLARIRCFTPAPIQFPTTQIYDEVIHPLTNAEADACVEDFFAIADALPINPCD